MPKVKLKVSLAGRASAGDVIEVTRNEANRMIQKGHAERVHEEPKVETRGRPKKTYSKKSYSKKKSTKSSK